MVIVVDRKLYASVGETAVKAGALGIVCCSGFCTGPAQAMGAEE